MVCQACQQQGVKVGTYCSGCGAAYMAQGFAVPEPRLFRARQGKVVAGVCAGIAARWGWDPILVRLVLVALVFCGFGTAVLAYLAAWIVVPRAPLVYGFVPTAPSGPAPAAA